MKTFLQRSVAQHDTAAWLSGLITSIAMQMQPTTSEIRQSTIWYASSLGGWDKQLVNQASDVPSIIFFS